MSEGKPIPKESERRQATVMFADLSGFTAMSEKMDPEQVTNIMNDCFSMMTAVIENHGGFIDKFMGDCVMALFGVPTAIEDAPHKAINTAIDLRNSLYRFNRERTLENPLDIHIGINSGMVIAGWLGGRQRREYTVIGDTVNLASRLEDASDMGKIFVGEATYLLTRDDFDYKALSPIPLKGKEQRVPVYELLSIKEKIHHRRLGESRMIHSKMVGRDRELDRLHLHLLKVINGEGSIVNIIGEAGIGKSRLLAEFEHKEEIKKVHFLQGRGLSIGQNLSFHPLIDLLKGWADIKEDESDTIAREKLERVIHQTAPDDDDEIFPFIATLMGMKLTDKHAERIKGIEGEALEKLILKNFRGLLIKIAAQKPLVMVIEDLHWIDTSSLELLLVFYRLVRNHSILFINVFRPNYEETGDRLLQTIHEEYSDHIFDIYLQPLSETQSDELVHNLLRIKGLPSSVRQQIIDRSEGNPFFIEEVIRSFIDEGVIETRRGIFEVTSQIESVVVPHSIHDLLMERIDRLDEETRTLVRNAAVIGRSFFYRILSEIATTIEDMDERLSYLESVQLIREGKRKEELEYLFKHALAQEAAYESILLEKRKELHRNVAQSIEKVFSERLHEFYGMLAMHYSKAEDTDKAEEYMLKAGEEALKSSASSEALHFFQEALKMYLKNRGDAADPEKIVSFERNIAIALYYRGHMLEALKHYDRVLQLWGEKLPENPILLGFRMIRDLSRIITDLYWPWSRWKRNRRTPTRHDIDILDLFETRLWALALADDQLLLTSQMLALGSKGTRLDLAQTEQGPRIWGYVSVIFSYGGISLRMGERCLQRAETLKGERDIESIMFLLFCRALLDHCSGAWQDMRSYDQASVDLAIDAGKIRYATSYIWWFGLVKIEQGEFEMAHLLIERLAEICELYDDDLAEIFYKWLQTDLLIRKGKAHDALFVADAGYRVAVRAGLPVSEVHLLGMRSICEMMTDRVAEARESAIRAEEIRRKHGLLTPTASAPFLVGQFMADIYALEDAIHHGDRSATAERGKRAFQSGKKALRNSVRYAYLRTRIQKLMGDYYWLVDKQRMSFKWWGKAIQEGEHLGARVDLSRTYLEVGQRLMEDGCKYQEFRGTNAKGYLTKAEELFREMDLQNDLEKLERVRAHLTGG